jgi:hypothetical protein
MSSKNNFGSFERGGRRRSSLPIIPIVLVVLLVALLAFFWSRGGEQPQQRVEQTIASENLGK